VVGRRAGVGGACRSTGSRPWSRALRALCLLILSLCLPLAMPRLATADLSTEPTVKTGEPTVKSGGDLDTGPASTGTVVLTPGPGPKPTGGPKPSASTKSSASASDVAPPIEPTPSASASGSSSSASKTPGSYERRKLSIGVGDLAIAVKVPDDWAEVAEESLPIIEPSEDAKVVLRKGFGVHAPKGKPPQIHELVVVCVKAQGDYWGDNIRDAAFSQMISGIEKEATKYTTLQSIEPEPIRTNGDRFEQPFAAEADFAVDGKTAPASAGGKKKAAAPRVKLLGLSFIGFHGEDKGAPTLVACSLGCAQLTSGDDIYACPAVVGSIEISGTFAPPPKRSWIAELLFTLKKDPTTMWLVIIGGVFLLVVIVVVIVLIARRKPKAARAQEHEHEDHDEHDEHEEPEGFDAGYQAGLAAARAAAGPAPAQGAVDSLHASAPPPAGYHDPTTLEPRA
jgi:hypothetical protein